MRVMQRASPPLSSSAGEAAHQRAPCTGLLHGGLVAALAVPPPHPSAVTQRMQAVHLNMPEEDVHRGTNKQKHNIFTFITLLKRYSLLR